MTASSTAPRSASSWPTCARSSRSGTRTRHSADDPTLHRLAPVRLVAVDGPEGAGKSTFARRLAAALGDATVIETDDFASAADPLGWWDRFEREVLEPLSTRAPIRYRRWDWLEERLGAFREHRASETVIVEGVSSARRAVADRLSFAIWIETPSDARLARGLARDGEQARPFWAPPG